MIRLPHVALRVVGDVYQKAAKCGRELLPADGSRLREIALGKCANSFACSGDGLAQFRKECVPRCSRLEFRLHARYLFGVQRIPFSISEQSVHAACDVPNVKCNGRNS